MGRPREYDRDAVITAAKEVFWRTGYEAAGLDVLEEATQLSRSSMYVAFGSKHGLFDEAIAEYEATFIESVLGPVESPDADPKDAAGFFTAVAALIRGDLGNRGCLVVNSIGELGGRDASVAREGAELHARYLAAFGRALAPSAAEGSEADALAAERARILAAAAMGVWITSRVDPVAAAEACDAVVEQIRVWTRPRPRR
jgi:AcrR family transcriptional regulator